MRKYIIMLLLTVSCFILVFVGFGCSASLPGFSSITFVDTDMGSGQLGGTVAITRSADESKMTHYVVYWGKSATEKLDGQAAIGEVAISETELVVVIPQNTVIPSGATHILVFPKKGDKESEENGSAAIVDLGSTVTVTFSHSLSNVDSFSIVVEGADMETVTQSGDASTTQFVVEVKDGTAREFEVTANISASAAGAALTYSASTTKDLSPGTPAAVTLTVDRLSSTKIVIPDHGDYHNNFRLVQINDMSGSGWDEITYTDVSWASVMGDFIPYDVDFDNQGRFYMANRTGSASRAGVVRFDSFSGSAATEIAGTNNYAYCLTIDRANDVIYYCTGDDGYVIFKCGIDGSSHSQLPNTGEISSAIRGLAVDGNGKLYIAGAGDSDNVLYRYDLSTETIDKKWGGSHTDIIDTVWDVLIKDDSVYLTNYKGADGYLLLRFDKNLTLLEGWGDNADDKDNPVGDELIGPHRFVATLNKKITVIDDYDSGSSDSDTERLFSINDISGSGWETFDPSEIDKSAFGFFEYY